ncbi:hypothetical protein [uncultured Xanthomonas sp.]|uniref:hypothetical protein n=1 Tax=uncultured Xanthomonas sp. TaxID=152831 RepID=UPI0025D74F9A|nr:hypothetical protein [uncultured Xanthomonas sp.]
MTKRCSGGPSISVQVDPKVHWTLSHGFRISFYSASIFFCFFINPVFAGEASSANSNSSITYYRIADIKANTNGYMPWIVAINFLARPITISSVVKLSDKTPERFVCVSDLYLDRSTGLVAGYESVEAPTVEVSRIVRDMTSQWKLIPEEVNENKFIKITVAVYFKKLPTEGKFLVTVAH